MLTLLFVSGTVKEEKIEENRAVVGEWVFGVRHFAALGKSSRLLHFPEMTTLNIVAQIVGVIFRTFTKE